MEEKTRILLVDDDKGVLNITAELLTSHGAAVDAVSSVLEAIQRLDDNEYDAIISDIRLPGIGGLGLYKWVSINRPGLESSMVFVSGDTTDAETFDFIERTGVTCLQKPYATAVLMKAVEAAMAEAATLSS